MWKSEISSSALLKKSFPLNWTSYLLNKRLWLSPNVIVSAHVRPPRINSSSLTSELSDTFTHEVSEYGRGHVLWLVCSWTGVILGLLFYSRRNRWQLLSYSHLYVVCLYSIASRGEGNLILCQITLILPHLDNWHYCKSSLWATTSVYSQL